MASHWTKGRGLSKSKVFGKTISGKEVKVTMFKDGRFKTQVKGLCASFNVGQGAAQRAIRLAQLHVGTHTIGPGGRMIRR